MSSLVIRNIRWCRWSLFKDILSLFKSIWSKHYKQVSHGATLIFDDIFFSTILLLVTAQQSLLSSIYSLIIFTHRTPRIQRWSGGFYLRFANVPDVRFENYMDIGKVDICRDWDEIKRKISSLNLYKDCTGWSQKRGSRESSPASWTPDIFHWTSWTHDIFTS